MADPIKIEFKLESKLAAARRAGDAQQVEFYEADKQNASRELSGSYQDAYSSKRGLFWKMAG